MSADESFTEIENELFAEVPDALADGVALLKWWKEKDPRKNYKQHYEETKTLNRPDDNSYGFFDSVQLPSSRETVPINGNVADMFYDDAKAPTGDEKLGKKAAELMHDQIKAFILNYFMRISDFRQPELVEADGEDHDTETSGFGFEQVYFKRRGSHDICKFEENLRSNIVPLTELSEGRDGEEPYEWIVLKNPIFGFGFSFKLLGDVLENLIGVTGPVVKIPAEVFNYLVISKDFVVNEEFDPPRDGLRARYGFGYAFVNDPEPSVYGYGPGQLQPAFEQMIWEVYDTGVIKVKAIFVAQEPTEILKLSVDPLAWGFQATKALGGEVPGFLQPVKRMWDKLPLTNTTFDPVLPTVRLLDLLTLGQAGKLGLPTKDGVIKDALFLHFQQHYQTILGSLQTWRQIKDWTVEKDLPDWVVSGKSS